MFTSLIRQADSDVYKSAAVLKEQMDKKLVCKLEWCGKPLTNKKGPGDKHLCRSHQIAQREYGGLGRLDRPWTFSREWTCSCCGYNPKEDPWFEQQKWDNESHKNMAMRSMLVGDHKIRQADGGSDDPENVQTLCQNCNAKKTALHKDHQRSRS
jgi:hypothetical protein